VKISVIITTHKDLEALGLTLDTLMLQDYKNFEVVIAEDDNDQSTIEFLKNYPLLAIQHVSHEDVGWTKTVIQNKAANIEKYYWLYFLGFMFDKETRFEQGFFISPDSLIYKIFFLARERSASILGCNFLCFK